MAPAENEFDVPGLQGALCVQGTVSSTLWDVTGFLRPLSPVLSFQYTQLQAAIPLSIPASVDGVISLQNYCL